MERIILALCFVVSTQSNLVETIHHLVKRQSQDGGDMIQFTPEVGHKILIIFLQYIIV